MINLRTVFLCAAALVPLAMPGFADDPYLTVGGTNCDGTVWCPNVGSALDNYNGVNATTLGYLLDLNGSTSGIPTVTDGDVLITATSGGVTADGVSNVVAVIDFENVSDYTGITSPGLDVPTNNVGISTAYTGPVAFIFSVFGGTTAPLSDLTGNYSLNAVHVQATAGAYYDPTSTQPGGGIIYPTGTLAMYDLVIPTPEPSVIVLLVMMLGMLGVGGLSSVRRRFSGHA